LTQRRGQEALGAIGTPAQVTATIRDLQAKHVTHFLCYMDLGGLSYQQMAPAMRLFAEQVMPRFK
jgi:hypothetical protein